MESEKVESEFVSVKSKKSRKRKLSKPEETGESVMETTQSVTDSEPSASKRPNLPPISADQLKVIVFSLAGFVYE